MARVAGQAPDYIDLTDEQARRFIDIYGHKLNFKPISIDFDEERAEKYLISCLQNVFYRIQKPRIKDYVPHVIEISCLMEDSDQEIVYQMTGAIDEGEPCAEPEAILQAFAEFANKLLAEIMTAVPKAVAAVPPARSYSIST